MSTSRILNITPTNRTRVKSPLHDLMKSIERSINLEESKPKSVKIEPKKLVIENEFKSIISRNRHQQVRMLNLKPRQT